MEAKDTIATVRQIVFTVNGLPSETRTSLIYQMEHELRKLKVGDNDSVDGFVYSTKDLTQFKDIVGNRLINDNSVYIQKLADSIRRIGNVVPVVINNKWETIDGQRRIRAIRKFGLPNPVKYIRHINADIEVVGDINRLQIKWNHRDWLNKYSSLENPHYIAYEELAEKYEKFMKSRSLRGLLMNGRVDPLKTEVWETGQFTINNEQLPLAVNYLEILKKVYLIGEKENIFASDRGFQKALFEVVKRAKKLDVERLLYKIKWGFNRLNIKTDFQSYKKVLGSLYNTRLSGDKHHIITESEQLVPVV